MHYLVKGEFIEENLAGKTPEEAAMYIEQVIHPSLEMLWNWEQAKKVMGGVIAGERTAAFLLDAESNAEVGRMLRALPFWGAMRWNIAPIQSVQSAIEQDRESIKAWRGMTAPMEAAPMPTASN
jgi:hypothetical protein